MKAWTLAGAVALLAAVAVGPTSDRVPPGRLDLVLARGELRVCSTGDYQPFTYHDPVNGRWSGIDVDLAADLAARLGVRRSMVPTTWPTLLRDFSARCDIAMGGIAVTPDRARHASFSTSYLLDGKTPITRCTNAGRFTTLEEIDQPGVRVVVNPGGTNEQFVRSHLHRATILPWPDNNTVFDQLISGHAEVMVTDASEARWQAVRHPRLCPVHPDHPFSTAAKAYLLPPGDEIWKRRVDSWLADVRHDGTWDRIANPLLGLVD
ncbi:MAG: transporter substrate-binding domain-containing protein [Kutzneria sp.]|nr:transporter substrate-binding domain-containing protein [Kutzneria sp.]